MTRTAFLCIEGYAGRIEQPVEIVGETRTKYRVRSDRRLRLGGGYRWAEPNTVVLVPKRAVRVNGRPA